MSRLYENDEDWRNEPKDDLEIDDVATSAKGDEDAGDDGTVIRGGALRADRVMEATWIRM